MPIVQACSFPRCSTLTMGEFCVEHEVILDETGFALEPLLDEEIAQVALDPVP